MRTKETITELDIELDLFDINEWDFNKPYATNSEYKSWVDDDDLFDIGVDAVVHRLPMAVYAVIFIGVLSVSGFIAYQLAQPSKDYLSVLALESQMEKQQIIEYVEGNEISDAELIDISKICTTYFNILNAQKGYDLMDSLCLESSSFNKECSTNVAKMRYSYDMYDCYVRLIKYYGSYCTLNKIQKVTEKNGVYYCYLDVTAPSKEDISSYIKLYSYKHFTATEFNQANLVRYMYSMAGVSKIPCSHQIICLTFRQNGIGNILLYDDTSITNLCVDAYTETLEDISVLMGVKIEK